jgi:uncharacterized protein YcbK (DUF882 family)
MGNRPPNSIRDSGRSLQMKSGCMAATFTKLPAPMQLATGTPGPLDPQQFLSSRRAFVCAAAAMSLATSISALATVPDWGKTPSQVPSAFWTQERWVWLKRPDTGEEIRLVYWANGQLIQQAYQQISWFLRDRRFEKMMATDSPVIAKAIGVGRVTKQQITPWALMDPIVLDILYAYSSWLQAYGLARALMVTSGFRHFITNELTEGAVLASWHPKAGAVDFFIPGVPVEQVARFGTWLAGGGVGLYLKKNFIHVDRGSVRHWRS